MKFRTILFSTKTELKEFFYLENFSSGHETFQTILADGQRPNAKICWENPYINYFLHTSDL